MTARFCFRAAPDLQAHRILDLPVAARVHAYARLRESAREDAARRGIKPESARRLANTLVERQERLVQILEWTGNRTPLPPVADRL